MHVSFKNKHTGEIKQVKVGWSWTLFLFGQLLGIPFFMRKYPTMGFVMLGVFLLNFAISYLAMNYDGEGILLLSKAFRFVILAIAIWLGVAGNKMTARYYRANGWEIQNPETAAVEHAKQKWGMR